MTEVISKDYLCVKRETGIFLIEVNIKFVGIFQIHFNICGQVDKKGGKSDVVGCC